MTQLTDFQQEFSERASHFHEVFGGEEFIEDSIIEASARLWRLASVLYGEDAAEGALNVLVGACFPAALRGTAWRDVLDEEANGIYSETPGGGLLHDLTAYADFGILLASWRDTSEREQALELQVTSGLLLLELISANLQSPETSPIWRIVTKAAARWKLDSGRALNKIDLSLLSGLADQSIKNKLSGKSKELEGSAHHIEAHNALAWLSGQKKFVSSIWRDQSGIEYAPYDVGNLESFAFVPVAVDGSHFHAGLKRDDVYTIGIGSAEMQTDDFEDALAKLQSMAVPTWLRPNSVGRWTHVRSLKWARVSYQDLEAKIPDG